MSYTHLTKTELIFIEEYFAIGLKGRQIAERLLRGHEAIYRVIRQLKAGKTAIEIYREYKQNKQKCGRKPIQLPQDEIEYINEKTEEGWTPDVIIGRKEKPISCVLVSVKDTTSPKSISFGFVFIIYVLFDFLKKNISCPPILL